MSHLAEAVVLFGASGFIGRNLVDALQGRVGRLIGVTHSTPQVPGCDETVLMDRLDEIKPLPLDTVVVNMAAHRYHAASFQADQSLILERNVALANQVYDFCLARSIREVRLASSVAIYPASFDLLDDERPFDLGDWPHEGESFYAWSKRWSEILAELYRRRFGINTIAFRLTNPYGPYDTLDIDAAHVATAFTLRALQPGNEFSIRGNADARRDFIFSGDVAEAFALSLKTRGQNGAYNLGYGETVSVRDLAGAALRAAGASHKKITLQNPATSGGVNVRAATGNKIRRDFNLPTFCSLDAGLVATVRWYRDVLGQ